MGLKDLSAVEFVKALSSKEPTPGGGSAAALVGATGLGLLFMVANYIENQEAVKHVFGPFEMAKNTLLDLINLDADSFNLYMEAIRLPKNTEEEKKIRSGKIQEALAYASQIPFQTMKACVSVLPYLSVLEQNCKKNMISDLGAAATCLRSSIESAYLNIIINAGSIKDPAVSGPLLSDGNQMIQDSLPVLEELYQRVVILLGPNA